MKIAELNLDCSYLGNYAHLGILRNIMSFTLKNILWILLGGGCGGVGGGGGGINVELFVDNLRYWRFWVIDVFFYQQQNMS